MKIRRLSEYQGVIRFPNFDSDYELLYQCFLKTSLGKIYSAIPWNDLVKTFGLREKSKGPRSIFSPRGKIALMFLKHYTGSSDRKLIEQLNGNIYYQIFCDIIIDPTEFVENYKIVSQIRCELSELLNINDIQKVLAESWRPYLNNKDSMCCDATCYQSYVRYPTDIKLLYEAVVWNYRWYKKWSKQLGQKQMRSKYNKWMRRYHNYSKSRRPSRKIKRSLYRALIGLLEKINTALIEIELLIDNKTDSYTQRRETTSIIITQQKAKFYFGKKPKQRIISLDKPYLRPIVRGKETKSVEFGAKVHKLQVDGISFIEHISFDAYNEGTRLESSIYLAQLLTRTQVNVLGADGIYATNSNRRYVTKKNIKTDFKRKGRPSKHKEHFSQLAKIITKERASRLEGSFGTDKEHFLLNHIKARTEKTEILWIVFGIHTANALKIGKRMTKSDKLAA